MPRVYSEPRTYTLEGKEVQFNNLYRENRSGFVHETDLYINDVWYAHCKVQYYNRTWECYEYQSVQQGAIHTAQECMIDSFKSEWRARTGKSRVSKGLIDAFKQTDPQYTYLSRLYEAIKSYGASRSGCLDKVDETKKQIETENEKWFDSFKEKYDGLSDNMKGILSRSAPTLTSKEQADDIINSAVAFDTLMSLF